MYQFNSTPHKVQEAFEQCIEELTFEQESFNDYNEERDGARLTRYDYSMTEDDQGWNIFEHRTYTDDFLGKVQATSCRFKITIDNNFNAKITTIK